LFGCYWLYKIIKIANLLILQKKRKRKSISEKKVKKVYSITTQTRKVFGIFDDKKVKNIEYNRLQSIFPNPVTKLYYLFYCKNTCFMSYLVERTRGGDIRHSIVFTALLKMCEIFTLPINPFELSQYHYNSFKEVPVLIPNF